jgi:GT2 family glycosyltransferase
VTDLSISIITANKKLVLDCLKSIYETTGELSFDIYVVINNPRVSGDIETAIKGRFPAVKLIINREEKGFTQNNNMVMKKCAGKYILLLNDDTIIRDDTLEKMVRYMEDHPVVGILGCKILNPDGSLQWSCGKSFNHKFEYFKAGLLRTLLAPLVRDQFFNTTQEVSWVTGACLMARAEAVKKVGLMDENIYMYFDDGDWCYRIIRGGWKVVYYYDAEIIHYRSQTSKSILARTTTFYYRSRLYFFWKHYNSFVLHSVKILTLLDIVLRYVRTLIFQSDHTQKRELLDAYQKMIRMVLSFKDNKYGLS